MLKTMSVKLSLIALACGAATAFADQARRIDVPAGDLVVALESISKQADVELVFQPEQLKGLRTKGVSGMLSSEEAVRKLLEGTQLQLRTDKNTGAMMIGAAEPASSGSKSSSAGSVESSLRLASTQSSPSRADEAAGGAEDAQNKPGAMGGGEHGNGGRIDEIIVTAQKRAQQAIDVPMSVSAVSGNRLEELGINNALELSYRIPGLVVQETSSGKQLYTLRGIGNTFGTSALVGVYLDELDMTSAVPSISMDMSLYDLARVEVLRGPQGTLWGAGSMGGTVRFITNEPQLDRFSGKAEVSVFGQSRGDSSYEARGAVNVPVVEDKFALRFSGTYQNWGGWIDRPEAGRENVNDGELMNARGRALWRPNDRFELSATAIVHRIEGGAENIANIAPYGDSNTRTFIDPALATPYDDDYDHVNLTLKYDFGRVSLLSATGYTQRERQDVDTRRLAFASNFIPSIPNTQNLDINSFGRRDSDAFTQELRLTTQGDSAFTGTGGVFYRQEDLTTDTFQDQLLGPLVLATKARNLTVQNNESWAAFADASYALTQRWKVGAGLRYFEETRKSATPLLNQRAEGKFDDSSPRIYTSFAVNKDINLYVNVAQGFRSGGFNSAAVIAAGGPGSYDPDTVTSYEIGAKMLLADGRFYTELALFHSDYTDMQAVGFLPGLPVNVTSNIGEATIEGVEWAFLWRPTDRLTFGFNGSLLDTEVTKLRASSTSHRVGDPLDQVADYNYSVTADYDFTWAGNTPGFIRFGFNEQGPTHWTSRSVNLLIPVGVSDTLSFLSANIGATFGDTTVELFGRNLLDEDGPSNPYGQCCSIQPQPRPVSFGLRVAHSFE